MKTEKRFVPYGMNKQYYVYDNHNGRIPIGFGYKHGTKKYIKSLCDKLNYDLSHEEPEETDNRANNRSPFGIGS